MKIAYKLEDLCRLCLNQLGKDNIFEPVNMTDDIFTVTGVKVVHNDPLPQKICERCLKTIKEAICLKLVSKKNEKQLKYLLFSETDYNCDSECTYNQVSQQSKVSKNYSQEQKTLTNTNGVPSKSNDEPNAISERVVEVNDVGEISKDIVININEELEDTFCFSPDLQEPDIDANSVLKLLKHTVDGKAILNFGRSNGGLLDNTLRSRLARLKKSSGKLYDAVVNRRKDLRKRGVLSGSSRCSKSSDTSSVTSVTEETQLTLLSIQSEGESEVEEKLQWLRKSIDPWHLVESNWTTTTKARLATLQTESGTVEEYFNLYRALKQPEGFRLLLQDFDNMYKNNKDFLYSNTILYQNNILSVAKSKIQHLKEKDVKRAIQSYIDSISDEKPESETYAALLVLPYLIPLVPSKKGKPTWKPSRSEIRDEPSLIYKPSS